VVSEQLDLALALQPTFAVVSVGAADAAQNLEFVAAGDSSFLVALLAETRFVVRSLRQAGAAVLLVKPLVLANTPAAWIRFGACPPIKRPLGQGIGLPPELVYLARVDSFWRRAVAGIAADFGAAFVDLASILEELVARGANLEVGLPPQSGEPGDLFADALYVSSLGAQLAADQIELATFAYYAEARSASAPRRICVTQSATAHEMLTQAASSRTLPRVENDPRRSKVLQCGGPVEAP